MYVRSAVTFLLVATISATALSRAEAQVPSWAKVTPQQTAAAKKLGVPVAFENSVGMRLVLIPAGKFKMGSRDSAAEVAKRCAMPNAQAGWFQDEHPRRQVTLTRPFYMSIHEVTQEAYQKVTNPNPDENAKKALDAYPAEYKGANMPAGNVAFNDAEKFCNTLAGLEAEKEEGRKYYVPTEAEWEYACRAGTETPFSFGEAASTKQANYHGDYTYGDGQKGENRQKPVTAGSLPPNPWGLHEMHGNLSEWCSDKYDKYGRAAETDPKGSEKGNARILRGGSWRSYPGACRSAFRHRNEPGMRSYNIGFRICCAAVKEPEAEKKAK